MDVRITWPGSGGGNLIQDAPGVAVGQYVTVHEGDHASLGQTTGTVSGIVMECVPNPFTGTVKVALGASPGARIGAQVFDVGGRLVADFDEAVAKAEDHTFQWDGKSPDGEMLPPGIYFWKVQVGEQVATRKVVMVR